MNDDDILQGDSRHQIRKNRASSLSSSSAQKQTTLSSKNVNNDNIDNTKKRSSIGVAKSNIITGTIKPDEITPTPLKRKSIKTDSSSTESTESTSSNSSNSNSISNGTDIPTRRRTKSLGGATNIPKVKEENSSTSNNKKTTTTTIPPALPSFPSYPSLSASLAASNPIKSIVPTSTSTTTSTSTSTQQKQTNPSHKRKSEEKENDEDDLNIFQTSRYTKNKEKEGNNIMVKKEKEMEKEEKLPIKKKRYSTAGVMTQFEKDRKADLELAAAREKERLAELERLRVAREMEEELARLRVEKERELEAGRLARLAKMKQPKTLNTIGAGAVSSTFVKPQLKAPIVSNTNQYHVYPKTPGPQPSTTPAAFQYNDYPTSKQLFTNANESFSHIQFETEDVDFYQDELETQPIDENEFEFDISSESDSDSNSSSDNSSDIVEEQIQLQQKREQQKKKLPLKQKTVLEENDFSSYFLVFISFCMWAVLLFILARFYYRFNDIRYCDSDAIPTLLPNSKHYCVMCPDKGVCFNEQFYTCASGYVKKGQNCVIDPSRVDAFVNVFGNVDQVLRDYKGRFECGVSGSLEMPAAQLEEEFNRRYWIRNEQVRSAYAKLIEVITDRSVDTAELGIDRSMVASVHHSYDSATKQFSFYTSNEAHRPLWCQTYFTLKQMFLEYLPLLIGVFAGYVFYRYYRYRQVKSEEEMLHVENITKEIIRLLKQQSQNQDEPWLSEIMLKEEIIGEDRSAYTLKLWELAKEKVVASNKILNTPRFVYGESMDTFEFSSTGVFKESATPKKSRSNSTSTTPTHENDNDMEDNYENTANNDNTWR